MEIQVIITLCLLLLTSYIFDITSSKTKVPSVILLLILGWGVAQFTHILGLNIPDLSPSLPVLGTIGLILIVLEGSSELELDQSKAQTVLKTSIIALLPMIILAFGLAFLFQYLSEISFKNALINAIPLSVISSAIAIPSANNLDKSNKEFIIYESSLSDIFGVIFFNFLVSNDQITMNSIGVFTVELAVMLVISLSATVALVYLLRKINHHVKFIPIIIIIVLIYTTAKLVHLPALIFILLFGISLKNINKFSNFRLIQNLKPDILVSEVNKFKELTIELTFLIRSLFFILFGFLIKISDLLNSELIGLAIIITGLIFLIRTIFLFILGMPLKPLIFIAPRGLITILLFISIPTDQTFELVNKSLIIQVIILSALVMMTGFLITKTPVDSNQD